MPDKKDDKKVTEAGRTRNASTSRMMSPTSSKSQKGQSTEFIE